MTQIQVKLVKSKEGILAQCMDKPEIIVTGKNKTQIKSGLKELVEGYVEAFPETKSEFFTKNNKMFEVVFVEV